jgi:hypothetical protein
MADSLVDVSINETTFTDLYAGSGITVGLALVVQNKSSSDIVLTIKATQPTAGLDTGVTLRPYDFAQIDAGETGLWAISSNKDGNVSVQDAT